MQNTSVQSDRLLVKGMLSMHLSTTRWVTCSWLMQLDIVAQKEGWASINTISSSGPQENKSYTFPHQSPLKEISLWVLICTWQQACHAVSTDLAPKDNNEESPSAAHLSKAFTQKRIQSRTAFNCTIRCVSWLANALSHRAFASQITGNFQQILLLPVKTHIQGNSIQCSQNLVKESSAPMVAVLASRYWNSFHQ